MMMGIDIRTTITNLCIAVCIGICAMLFWLVYSRDDSELRRSFRIGLEVFHINVILCGIGYIVKGMLVGIPGEKAHYAIFTGIFVGVVAVGIMEFIISNILLSLSQVAKVRKYRIMLVVFLVSHVILLSTTFFSDLLYYVDETNHLGYGSCSILAYLCPMLMTAMDIYVLIRYSHGMDKSTKSAAWVFLLVPLFAAVLQLIFKGTQLVIFSMVLAALYTSWVILRRQKELNEATKMERSRLEIELSTAAGIQTSMLPQVFPAFPMRKEFDLYASMDPAKEVGGDFYDFFLVDEDHLAVVIADVSGKGIPAALFMMAVKIIIANNVMMGKSPVKVLTDANGSICSKNPEEMFVTVWLGILEISTGRLVCSNGGHEYPILKKKGGNYEIYKHPHGLAVGIFPGYKFKEYEIQLEPGDKIFVYTDGLPEAIDEGEKQFGMDRITEVLNRNASEVPKQMIATMSEAVQSFVGEAEQFDDLTMLALEYKGKGKM